MSFMKLNRDELVKAAKFYKVDIEEDATKQNITNALLDAGKTPEQWEHDAEAHDNGLGPEDDNRGGAITTSMVSGADEEEDFDFVDDDEEPEPEEETEEASEPEMVLVRFVGNNASYTAGSRRFSRNKPFALMSRDEFEDLNQKKFRLANKREAEEFYGQ